MPRKKTTPDAKPDAIMSEGSPDQGAREPMERRPGRWHRLLLALACFAALHAAAEPGLPPSWEMSPEERSAFAIVDPAREAPLEARAEALAALGAGSSPEHALVLAFHACRLQARLWPTQPPEALARIEALGKETSASGADAALAKCRQWIAQAQGRDEAIVELGYQAHQLLTPETPSSLHAWIAYDHALAAHDAGLIDEAAAALEASLAFARANGLRSWEAESLGELALLQASLGEFADAIANSREALALVEDDEARGDLGIITWLHPAPSRPTRGGRGGLPLADRPPSPWTPPCHQRRLQPRRDPRRARPARRGPGPGRPLRGGRSGPGRRIPPPLPRHRPRRCPAGHQTDRGGC